MKKVKRVDIVHIISGDLWAGAEVQVFHTLSQLKKKGDFSIICVLFNDKMLNKKLREYKIETVIIDESNHNDSAIIMKLMGLFRKIKPKIIHVHAYKEHLLAELATILNHHRIGIVRTFHGMSEVPNALPLIKHIKSSIIHRIEKYFLNRKKLNIIAVSKDLEHFLKTSYPKAKVTQIYNAIPIIDTQLVVKEAVRKKYNIAENVFWIGAVARLSEPKNLSLLIDAGKQLKQVNIDFKISIWGEGPFRGMLQTRIEQNCLEDCIRLEGFEKNIFHVLKSIDLFVLSSLHEGLPISLLEAMTLETPVVCTAVGGIKEVISDNYSGLLVPSNNADALAAAILKLQKNSQLREKLSKNAKDKVDREFNIKYSNDRLINLYRSILKNQ